MDRRARGDFQTPPELAAQVVRRLEAFGYRPATVIEPTCGRGAFLQAARRWPARRLGWELDPAYVLEAAAHGEVVCADFLDVDWAAQAARWEPPVLILGNPPWVLAGQAERSPVRQNPGLRGIEALTGSGGFDVADWMIRRLQEARPDAVIAMLCKLSVARNLLRDGYRVREVWPVDARRWFGVSVEAGLLVLDPAAPIGRCQVGGRVWGVVDGVLVDDLEAWERSRHLIGRGPTWRSGVKHDAARVLEILAGRNGLGEEVDVEEEALWPYLKGGDLHAGRPAHRRLLLPQRSLSEPPDPPPRARAYLEAHASVLDGRRSRIYRGRPRFCVFGVGPYSFAPWKVAVAGLYPEPRFRVLGPVEGKPVLLDDTSYFLPFDEEDAAREVARLLTEPVVHDFLRARVFPGAKRPITARLLRSLDLSALSEVRGATASRRRSSEPGSSG